MQNFDIIKTSKPEKTFRVASVCGMFDLCSEKIEERFSGSLNFEHDWQIGLIVGRSGTGKTTIAKQLFKKEYIKNFSYSDSAVIDDMPQECSFQEIVSTLNAVGFSSPPSWLKKYSVLSNGEKMRVDLARALLDENDLFVFDEFTSVVDREIAKILSFASQKSIRKTNKKFIAVTCHYDVEDWLLPDWVFSADTMSMRKCAKKKDQKLTIKSMKQKKQKKQSYGKLLKNITI
jgi:ABC-type ATPase with predicted acetyltransferase domain